MLILALTITQPVAAQSFKPEFKAGLAEFTKGYRAQALMHFRPLAAQGHTQAQNLLGWMYYSGKGVTKDDKEAVKWFRKAAKQGNPHSLYNLGKMYRDGKGVLQDLVMAYVLFNVAVTNGNNYVRNKRDEVHAKLTAPERKLALKLSKPCLKKPAKCPEYSDD